MLKAAGRVKLLPEVLKAVNNSDAESSKASKSSYPKC
jgi:hypothetical protein